MLEAHHVLDQCTGAVGNPYAPKLPFGRVIIGEACLEKTHRPEKNNGNTINLFEEGRTSHFKPCSYNLRFKDDMASNIFNRTKEDDKMFLSMEDRSFLDVIFYKKISSF